jgi:hypothetical protein
MEGHTMSQFDSNPQRVTWVAPAFDCLMVQPCVHGSAECGLNEGRSHGRHGADMFFMLKKDDADITLVVRTGWDHPLTPSTMRLTVGMDYPAGGRVEIHTAAPTYVGQDSRPTHPEGTCKDWPGDVCYFAEGYLLADEPTRLLVEKGSEAVWDWLEEHYRSVVDDMNTTVSDMWK